MGERDKPQDWKIRQYYEQDELVQKIVELAEYREIAPTYPQGYGQRPDAINFPGDFKQFVEDGAVAFHASVERWRNPLLIDNVSDHDNLRNGWDLVIDIDCDYSFPLAKETAKLVIQELKEHGIENISVKFSGNRGFHIAVRSEAFPSKIGGEEIAKLYPELPRGIVNYLRSELEERMIQLVKKHDLEEEMETDSGLDPYQVSDIENDWGSRHLFRLPYSLHDGSWLVSLPIKPEEIDDFEKEDARIDNVDFETGFLDSYEEGEATNLVQMADDFLDKRRKEKEEEKEKRMNREFERPDDAIPEEYFPPTIHNIFDGLKDGRKRGLFIILNFLRTVGYSWNEIETKVWEWNENNHEPLQESYIKTQLDWHRKRNEDVPPPNYDSDGYYKDMQVYEGDNLEEKVSNPVSYAFRKAKKMDDDSEDDDTLECPKCGKLYKQKKSWEKHIAQCREDEKVRKLD